MFPLEYPNADNLPEFIYCQGTSIDDHLSESMLKTLRAAAYQRVKKGRTCLEQCLRALVTAMRKVYLNSNNDQLISDLNNKKNIFL